MYKERNEILRSLGFRSYPDYLESALWAKIRLGVLKAAGWSCQVCKGPGQTVHHSKYTKANLTGDSKRWLHAICHRCHEKVEVDEHGNKRTWEQSVIQFRKMLKKPPPRPKRRKGGKPWIGLAYKKRALARRRR